MGKQRRIKAMKAQIKTAVLQKMPLIMRQSKERHYLTTKEYCDLHNLTSKKEVGEADELYHKFTSKNYPGIPVDMPVQVAINHARGIKKAFLKGGNQLMKEYISKQVGTVLDYEKKQKEEKL